MLWGWMEKGIGWNMYKCNWFWVKWTGVCGTVSKSKRLFGIGWKWERFCDFKTGVSVQVKFWQVIHVHIV